ncbi:MAG: LysM domain-containing protein [Chloroflexota bacterium]
MVACVAIFCLWLTGCTLAPQSSGSSSPQPTPPPPSALPPVTITVFDDITDTPLPTRQSIVQLPQQGAPPPDPTPLRYTVKADDTLLEIAINYDLTLEALMLANPSIDPRALQIGQELVIPVPGQTTGGVNLPPVPLPVNPASCYPTATDSVLCMGIVGNDTAGPVEQVRLEVSIMDVQGIVIRTATAIVEQSYIEPGGSAPYRVLFNGVDDSAVATVSVRLIAAMASDTVAERFAPLVIEDASLVQDARQYTFTATVSTAGRTAQSPRLVLTLLGDEGQVYGYRIWDGDTPLFADVPVRVQMSVLPVVPIEEIGNLTYRVHAEARLLE